MEHDGHFPTLAAASLRFAQPAKLATPAEAYAFRAALAGRAQNHMGVAAQGPTTTDGLFIPAVLIQAGATFAWATPAEVTARSAGLVAALSRTPAVA